MRHAKLRSPLSTIMRVMKLSVECYSGRKADERPVRFWLEGTLYHVETALDQWYDPEHIFYKVHANDGNLYILRLETSTPDGQWDLIFIPARTCRIQSRLFVGRSAGARQILRPDFLNVKLCSAIAHGLQHLF